MGQHIITKQGGAFCHSPRTATGTKTSAFTTERNQVLHQNNLFNLELINSNELKADQC
jgi:hypothetical protein